MSQNAPRLGEVLRQAREAKDLDLQRVERDTKIRLRYLMALESGDYRDLPGAVYVRGFLRNYGHYLGLEAEQLIGLYRAETGAPDERPVALPRPATARPRTFIVTPGALVTLTLTLLVVLLVGYLAYQFVTFGGTPSLEVSDPARDLGAYSGSSYTIRGVTEPNSRIQVDGPRQDPEAMADERGAFEVTVNLVPGVNVITVVASDPRTGRDTEEVRRTITVATALPSETPRPEAAALIVETPADGATAPGKVTVTGQTDATVVTVSAVLVEPAAVNFTVSDAAGRPIEPATSEAMSPPPVQLTVDAGRFGGDVALPPGTWELTIAASGVAGDEQVELRTVEISLPAQLMARLEVRGGPSWLELYEDDLLDAQSSPPDAPDGASIDLTAARTIRIRAGSAGAVAVTVNGASLGTMGAVGDVVEWVVSATQQGG